MLTTKSKAQKLIKVEQLQKQYNNLQQKQDQWAVIQNLNKLYKVDRILLKHAYEHYPELQILKNSKEYKNIQKFYRYTLDNMAKIQQEYLMDEISVQGQLHTNYEINKKSTSKYIRDQITHYQQTFKQFRQKVNQQEYGVNGSKLYNFVKQCFNTKYTKVLIKGDEYFSADAHITQFYQIIKQYYCNSNGIDESVYRVENVWLTSQQILDLLTHWLKFNEDKQFYILYCRTQEKLKKDMQYLIAQAKKNKIKQDNGQKVSGVSHPINLKEELPAKNQLQIVSEIKNNEEIKQQIKQEIDDSKSINKSHVKVSNFLDRFKNNKFFQQDISNQHKNQKPRVLNKKQILMAKLPELYVYGCKRKYSISKRTTFDEIQSQSKTMNLQKFLNFCNHFQINNFLSRQLLTEIFKINAINRLNIDQPRFVKIMEIIIKTEEKTVDNFLQRKSVQEKLRSQAKLSNYKFSLIPINGKNLQTLQTQLQQKKIIKSKEKEQKLNLYFLKKQKQRQRGLYKKQKVVVSSKILPQFTNLNELQNMRDDRFDPQKFFGNDHDELLSQYESKIESAKDFTSTPSALQSILSKRLQKGNKILQKINSSILKSYE